MEKGGGRQRTSMVSRRRRMLGWSMLLRISLSCRMPSWTRLSTRRRSIALTATRAPVRRCAARCTSANEPFPTTLCSLYSPTSPSSLSSSPSIASAELAVASASASAPAPASSFGGYSLRSVGANVHGRFGLGAPRRGRCADLRR